MAMARAVGRSWLLIVYLRIVYQPISRVILEAGLRDDLSEYTIGVFPARLRFPQSHSDDHGQEQIGGQVGEHLSY